MNYLNLAGLALTSIFIISCGGGGGSSNPGDNNNPSAKIYDARDYMFNSKALGEVGLPTSVDDAIVSAYDENGNNINSDNEPLLTHTQESLSTNSIIERIYPYGVPFSTVPQEDKVIAVITIYDDFITREDNQTGSLLYNVSRFYKSGDTYDSNGVNSDGLNIVIHCSIVHNDLLSIENVGPTNLISFNDVLTVSCEDKDIAGNLVATSVKYFVKNIGEVLTISEKNSSKVFYLTAR